MKNKKKTRRTIHQILIRLMSVLFLLQMQGKLLLNVSMYDQSWGRRQSRNKETIRRTGSNDVSITNHSPRNAFFLVSMFIKVNTAFKVINNVPAIIQRDFRQRYDGNPLSRKLLYYFNFIAWTHKFK